MIQEIKTIVKNYLDNAKLCHFTTGTFLDGGDVQVSDKLTIPTELVQGNLLAFAKAGDKVRIIRNHGGQECFIVEIIGRELVMKNNKVRLRLEGSSQSQVYNVEEVLP